MGRHPVFATFLGLTSTTTSLADASREAVLADAPLAHRFLDAVEADRSGGPVAVLRDRARAGVVRAPGARSSTSRCTASGSAARPRPTRSATASSCFRARRAAAGGSAGVDRARLEEAPTHTRAGTKPRLRRSAAGELWNEMELEADRVAAVALRRDPRRRADASSARTRAQVDAHREGPRRRRAPRSTSTRPG